MIRRTMLFIPGNNPGMLTTGDILGADVLLLDLEDAVALEEKDAARILVREALLNIPFDHSEVGVRINPTDSPYWKDDLAEIIPALPDAILIPKATTESVALIDAEIEAIKAERGIEHDFKYFLLIESAASVMDLNQIAKASDKTESLLLGAEDYTTDMGVKRTAESKEIEFARFMLATAAKAHRLDAIDTPYTDIDDLVGLERDSQFAKSIGFTGRLLIHPSHIAPVEKIFSPTALEIEDALALLEEAEAARQDGRGVFSWKGKMVDLPVINRAKQIIASARSGGLL